MQRSPVEHSRATRWQGGLNPRPLIQDSAAVQRRGPGSAQRARRKRVIILVDTPNIFRSTQRTYGLGTRPDYRQLIRRGEALGRVRQAIAFVNGGVHPGFAEAMERLGFTLSRSEARDVDDHLTARAVALHQGAERVLLCSGDGDFLPLVALLQGHGKEVVVCAVEKNCSRRLRRQADHFFHMPTLDAPPAIAIPACGQRDR